MMKKRMKKLQLHKETVCRLDEQGSQHYPCTREGTTCATCTC